MNKKLPNKKTVRAAIRGSVPSGKLRRAKIVLSDADYGKHSIAGFTEYDKAGRTGEVIRIGAPQHDNAAGVTIRGHETRHATKHRVTRSRPMVANEALASQIVDDVNVETIPLPAGRDLTPYRRAHLAVALKDLREMLKDHRAVKAGKKADTVEGRNGRLVHSVRVLAMLDHYGRTGGGTALDAVRLRARKRLTAMLGVDVRRGLFEVIRLAKSHRTRNRAISMLVALMDVQESAEEEHDREEGLKHEPSDILNPVVEGTALDGKMKIRDLRPKSVYTAKEKQITRRFAPDGVNINAARYVNAIASGDSHGLFHRRIKEKAGGVVLIDASGSMCANEKNVAAICALVPTATVAYYSGSDGRGKGELVVYAYEGKRFAGKLPPESIHGGNAVDLPAIQWMMRQPKPWHLVSDLGFCGGNLGAEVIAHALVERGKQRGDLTVHASLEAAYEAFGGKGTMPDLN